MKRKKKKMTEGEERNGIGGSDRFAVKRIVRKAADES